MLQKPSLTGGGEQGRTLISFGMAQCNPDCQRKQVFNDYWNKFEAENPSCAWAHVTAFLVVLVDVRQVNEDSQAARETLWGQLFIHSANSYLLSLCLVQGSEPDPVLVQSEGLSSKFVGSHKSFGKLFLGDCFNQRVLFAGRRISFKEASLKQRRARDKFSRMQRQEVATW